MHLLTRNARRRPNREREADAGWAAEGAWGEGAGSTDEEALDMPESDVDEREWLVGFTVMIGL